LLPWIRGGGDGKENDLDEETSEAESHEKGAPAEDEVSSSSVEQENKDEADLNIVLETSVELHDRSGDAGELDDDDAKDLEAIIH
ncbi:hypothetical protein ACH0C8_16485, partial [Acetobacter lovaniensis]|uniref:hypothetical protein n=1 Tax=Acetobacter lovaniensis TaxID=104100 RepID=UPI00376F74F6